MSSEAIHESEFLRKFTRELSNKNAAIFAGAGLSMAAGFVDWKTLLHETIKDLSLDSNKEYDLVSVAQYSVNKAGGNKTQLAQTIFDCFEAIREPTENHTVLARLPINTYWTTNYDKLIERALEKAKKVPDVKHTVEQLSTTRFGRDAIVYKMHGDVEHSSNAVITKDDYEKYPLKMAPFVTALRGDLVKKTFLFLGFSFTDPNIDYILSRVRGQFENNSRHHYCIQKRITKEPGEMDDDFKYRQLKQDYFIRDLKRFSIFTVLVDDYSGITRLLKQLEANCNRSSVFISGSAEEYGAMPPNDAQAFIHNLSQRIASDKNRIITGFGLGVGSAVINGALSYLDSIDKTISDEYIVMRPFPQIATGGVSLPEQWTTYRKAMLSLAGIAIFIFGNKKGNDGNIVPANGMQQEFDLAIEVGVKVIPIGATGHMAKTLWEKINASFNTYFPNTQQNFKDHFSVIGNPSSTAEQLINSTTQLVKLLKED